MAKNKQVTKAKKVEKKKVFNRNKVLYWLKSLINNGVCKEIGIKHYLISIPVFLVAIFISVIPVLALGMNTKGSASIDSKYNDVIQEAIYDYANSDDDTLDFKVSNHQLLTFSGTENSQHVYQYSRSDMTFDIYYVNTLGVNGTFSEQVNTIVKNNTLQSVMFIGSEYYSLNLIVNKTTRGSTAGAYLKMDDISSLKAYLKNSVTTSSTISDAKTQVFTNFKTFIDNGYLSIKVSQVFLQVGILAAINAGITLVMWPILFLMTRGKNNPNRDIKFYQVMGISFMASLTPAILAMVLGFIMGGTYSTCAMLYVMIYGFRAMWLSMKYLRPQQY